MELDKASLTQDSTKGKPELFIDDSDRYARLRLIGWWDQEKIAAAKILVVGAGALGNEVLKNLALLGAGRVHLIDFDEIQDSNLTRSVLFRARHNGQPKALVAAEMAAGMNSDCTFIPMYGNVLTDIGLSARSAILTAPSLSVIEYELSAKSPPNDVSVMRSVAAVYPKV